MTNISPARARLMLRDACERYMIHNEQKMGALFAINRDPYDVHGYFSPALMQFGPRPGFGDWFACEIYEITEDIFRLHSHAGEFMYSLMEVIPLEEMPINWETEQERISNLPYDEMMAARDSDLPDQSIPTNVLRNLTSLITIFNVVMTNEKFNNRFYFDSQFEAYKTNHPYHTSYLINDNDSISIKIYKTIQNLKFLIQFVEQLPDFQGRTKYINSHLTAIEPVIEDYLKGIIAKELLASLNSSLTDKQSISEVESQLNNNFTMEILSKNHQSKSEHNLKLLSVISILIGVGIFTTLGLVFKRLYDSGGTSINFFKPLSQNFQEEITDVTSNVVPGL